MDLRFTATDGRTIGAAEYGDPDGVPVLWTHGGPGSRFEPLWLRDAAAEAGLRIVAVDRPGYGLSDPLPGRTILDGVADLLAVADQLSLREFRTVGVSTGGAYALATAAVAPERVLGAVACCSVTDMAWPPGRAAMSPPHAHALWDAPDRDAAIAAGIEVHGENGVKMLNGGMNAGLAQSDRDLFADRAWMSDAMHGFPAMWTFGGQGYADDRLADGHGWGEFDVSAIRCPVVVLHGAEDRILDVIHAHHTAAIVPGAELVVVEGLGHFSIEARVVPELVRLIS